MPTAEELWTCACFYLDWMDKSSNEQDQKECLEVARFFADQIIAGAVSCMFAAEVRIVECEPMDNDDIRRILGE